MPGTLTATSLSNIIDVEEGFGSSATTAGSMGSSTMPLAYYYGYPQPSQNVKLYKILMGRSTYTPIVPDSLSKGAGLAFSQPEGWERRAGVAELVDALVLGTSASRHGGSSPSARTTL